MILTGVEVEDESVRKVLISCKSDLLEMCEEKILPPCGSQIHLTGTAEFLEEARNPGQFSYRMYYRGLGIRNRVTADRIFISEGKSSPLRSQAECFRTYATAVFQEICVPEDAGIFQAILLGDKSGLSEELRERFQDILQLCHEHLIVNMCDCFTDQFITVKFYGISIFVINIIPKRLELLLVEVIIQCILLNLRLMAIGDHIIESVLIKDALNECMYAIGDFLTAFRDGCKSIVCEVCAILVGYVIIFIDIVVFDQITINVAALLIRYRNIAATDIERFTNEVFCGSLGWTIVEIFTDTFLKVRNKVFISIRGDDGQLIDFLYLAAEGVVVLTFAVLIYAKAKTTTNFLTLLCRRGLTAWQEETKADAARRMYSETWLGRRRYLPNITSDNWGQKSFAERCALNTPIQGTAADILKLAIARILKGLPGREWLRPILQIHDELTFIIPEDKLIEAVSFIRTCMEEKPFPEFDLPLIAEASAGPTFGMMEELED